MAASRAARASIWGELFGVPHSFVIEKERATLRDWYVIAGQAAPAPHFAHLEACAALRTVLVTVPRASRSSEHFPVGFDLHLLLMDTTFPIQRHWWYKSGTVNCPGLTESRRFSAAPPANKKNPPPPSRPLQSCKLLSSGVQPLYGNMQLL